MKPIVYTCTASDTKLTTSIIVAVSASIRNPTFMRTVPTWVQVYRSASIGCRASTTCWNTKPDATVAAATPRMATECAPRRPMARPSRPAITAPASGASATTRLRLIHCAIASAFQRIELIDVDRVHRAEQCHHDRQPDGRLGGRHGQNEKDEHLTVQVAQVTRERDEIRVHRQQHQLDRHQQHDQILPVQKDPDHRDREQQRPDSE